MMSASRGSVWLIACLLVGAQLFPSMPQFLGVASSQAAGETLVAVVAIATCGTIDILVRRALFCRACLVSPGAVALAALAVAVVILHALLADQFFSIDAGRFLASLIPLVLTIVGCMCFARAVASAPPNAVDRAVRISFWILIVVLVVRSVGINPAARVSDKAIFPFTETSHFALALSPILMYVCVTSSERHKALWILVGLGIALFQLSLSLMVACLLIAVAARRFVTIAAPVLAVGLLFLPAIAFEYFTARLDFTGGQSNLSNLGYLLGWEQLYAYLTQTAGWGVGFQQFGIHDVHAAAADAIIALTHSVDPNFQVVGFVLAKLAGELGIIGLLLAAMFLVLQTRCLRRLRAGGMDPAETFARCVVTAFTVDMFFRSPGYFVSSTYIFVGAVFVLVTRSGMAKRVRSASRFLPTSPPARLRVPSGPSGEPAV